MNKPSWLNKYAKYIAIVLFLCGIAFEIIELTGDIIKFSVTPYDIGSFVFDVGFILMLLFGLIAKKDKVTIIALSILKIFDGVHYPLVALQKVNNYNWQDGYVNSTLILFILSALCLFLVLVFFVCEKLTDKKIYWKLILLFLVLSAIFIFASFIVQVVDNHHNGKDWRNALESGYLSFLFFGMYFACVFVNNNEENTISE